MLNLSKIEEYRLPISMGILTIFGILAIQSTMFITLTGTEQNWPQEIGFAVIGISFVGLILTGILLSYKMVKFKAKK